MPAVLTALLLASRATGPALLEDTDTYVLLQKIAERGAPMSWFASDWPLENHFYRPVSTLFFELDAALYGGNAAGYGLTNALLAAALVWAAFWFFREATSMPWVAGASTGLFGLWIVGTGVPEVLATAARWMAFLVWLGLLRGGLKKLPQVALASGGLFFLSWALPAVAPLGGRIVGWLPGRTASVMSVFLVLGLAAMARWVRLCAPAGPAPPPDALDVPATKGTEPTPRDCRNGWVPVAVACLCFLLALCSYEQAVTIPLIVALLVVYFAGRHKKAGWGWVALAAGTVVAYVAARVAVVPSEPSAYHHQQFRFGHGVWLSLSDYTLPALSGIYSLQSFTGTGLELVFISSFWSRVGLVFGSAAAVVLMLGRGGRPFGVWPWLAALAAYLPMAWLKYFEHYHLLPAVFRAWAVVALGTAALRAAATAVSPPGLAAPRRQRPSPGSLLRR